MSLPSLCACCCAPATPQFKSITIFAPRVGYGCLTNTDNESGPTTNILCANSQAQGCCGATFLSVTFECMDGSATVYTINPGTGQVAISGSSVCCNNTLYPDQAYPYAPCCTGSEPLGTPCQPAGEGTCAPFTAVGNPPCIGGPCVCNGGTYAGAAGYYWEPINVGSQEEAGAIAQGLLAGLLATLEAAPMGTHIVVTPVYDAASTTAGLCLGICFTGSFTTTTYTLSATALPGWFGTANEGVGSPCSFEFGTIPNNVGYIALNGPVGGGSDGYCLNSNPFPFSWGFCGDACDEGMGGIYTEIIGEGSLVTGMWVSQYLVVNLGGCISCKVYGGGNAAGCSGTIPTDLGCNPAPMNTTATLYPTHVGGAWIMANLQCTGVTCGDGLISDANCGAAPM